MSEEFEIGKIYYQCFQYKGERFVLSYLFKELTPDGFARMNQVRRQNVLHRPQNLSHRFMSWDQLLELLKADNADNSIELWTFVENPPLDDLG